jgi:hypothetical protein
VFVSALILAINFAPVPDKTTLVVELALIALGVGFAGTPASHSLTGSVPVRRAGMASGTADLQRDLGGAIMQSILGALLTAGYASAVAVSILAEQGQDQHQRRKRAGEVLLQRRRHRAALSPLRLPDHRRGQVLLPLRSGLGLYRRDRRRPAGRGDRVLPVSGS